MAPLNSVGFVSETDHYFKLTRFSLVANMSMTTTIVYMTTMETGMILLVFLSPITLLVVYRMTMGTI